MSDRLKFVVCGNVDDGKSTLIGRLLYDTESLFTDQIEELNRISLTRKNTEDNSELNFALITDGLKSEREQGITIDVAYRFFATKHRAFCIIDVPGHQQYLRNMFTGASQADIGLLLVDISKGINDQTKRHLILLTLIQTNHIFILINKMDLVNYSEEQFQILKSQLEDLLKIYGWINYTITPISSLKGEGIITPSKKMPWFKDSCLLKQLEQYELPKTTHGEDAGFIQGTIRSTGDFRAYMTHYFNRSFKSGEKVFVHSPDEETPRQVTLKESSDYWFSTVDDHDLSRGSIISKKEYKSQDTVNALLCWFQNSSPNNVNYLMSYNGTTIPCLLEEIHGKMNIHEKQIEKLNGPGAINDILHVNIKLSRPHVFEQYEVNKKLGCFLFIDPLTNQTLAAGIVKS